MAKPIYEENLLILEDYYLHIKLGNSHLNRTYIRTSLNRFLTFTNCLFVDVRKEHVIAFIKNLLNSKDGRGEPGSPLKLKSIQNYCKTIYNFLFWLKFIERKSDIVREEFELLKSIQHLTRSEICLKVDCYGGNPAPEIQKNDCALAKSLYCEHPFNLDLITSYLKNNRSPRHGVIINSYVMSTRHQAILKHYENLFGQEDLTLFDFPRMIKLYEYFTTRHTRESKPISFITVCVYMSYLCIFFNWVSSKKEYNFTLDHRVRSFCRQKNTLPYGNVEALVAAARKELTPEESKYLAGIKQEVTTAELSNGMPIITERIVSKAHSVEPDSIVPVEAKVTQIESPVLSKADQVHYGWALKAIESDIAKLKEDIRELPDDLSNLYKAINDLKMDLKTKCSHNDISTERLEAILQDRLNDVVKKTSYWTNLKNALFNKRIG